MTNETAVRTQQRRRPMRRRLFRTLNRYIEPTARDVGAPVLGPGIVVVETTGRRTGLPRRVALLAWRHANSITVSTIRPNSDWVSNLEHLPVAYVWLDRHPRTSRATVVRTPTGAVVHLTVACTAQPAPAS